MVWDDTHLITAPTRRDLERLERELAAAQQRIAQLEAELQRVTDQRDAALAVIEDELELETIEGEETRICRICGCTDFDCRGCIARTGEPCHWVEDDLCSACAPQDAGTEA